MLSHAHRGRFTHRPTHLPPAAEPGTATLRAAFFADGEAPMDDFLPPPPPGSALPPSSRKELPPALRAVLLGGLAVGVLDLLDALLVFGTLKGVGPTAIFQSIASGLLGEEAFKGGGATAALGLMLHFGIGLSVAAAYYAASRSLPPLRRRPWIWGPLYGVAVFLFMYLVVLPLSHAPRQPFTLLTVLNGVVGHAVLVGLPAALAARWAQPEA